MSRSEIACRSCEDSGVVLVESVRTVAIHSPDCGPDRCGSDCPIPIPILCLEEERCPDCGGQT